MYNIARIARLLFVGMTVPAPFLAMNADSPEWTLTWIGYGIIFITLAFISAVAVRNTR